MTLVAWLPDGVALIAWAAGATVGLGVIAALIARVFRTGEGAVAIRTVTAAPLVLPFGIAMLFGNLDVWYPLAYGALLLSALPGSSRRTQLAAGAAVAIITVAKLQPAPLLLWAAVVATRERGGAQARVLATALVTGLGIVALSLAVGGLGPWQDYVAVVRSGAGAQLVDPRNAGPISLLGQATGISGGALQAAQLVVTLVVVVVAVLGWLACP